MVPGGGIEPPTRGFSIRRLSRYINGLWSRVLSNPPLKINYLAANCQTFLPGASNELAGCEHMRGTEVRQRNAQADHHVSGGQGL